MKDEVGSGTPKTESGMSSSVRPRRSALRSPLYFILHPSSFILHRSSRRRGFSLTEVVVSAMIVGVLLAAAMRTVGSSLFTQYRTGEMIAAWSLADGLMTQVLAKQYKDPQGPPAFGPEPGELPSSKLDFDDVDDFHDWTESPPQYADGTTMPYLTGW